MIIQAIAGETIAPVTEGNCRDLEELLRALKSDALSDVSSISEGATALRFLMALYSVMPGTHTLTWSGRLAQRPHIILLDALKNLGAQFRFTPACGDTSCCRLDFEGCKMQGGTIRINAAVSSQYISALMLIAPTFAYGLTIRLEGRIASRPYIEMTAAIMQQCGAQVELSLQKNEIKIAPGAYRSAAYIRREGDWSAASFFYERSLLGGMQIKIKNLLPPSLTVQGDAAAARIWEQLGVTTTFTEQCEAILTPGGERVQTVEEDMSSVPDLVPPLVVSCCRASVPFTLTGIAALRLKESDRVQALCEGLLSLGYCVEADADTIYWNGNRAYAPTPTPTIDNKNDHRIAMAFAMGAPHPLLMPLTNRECVSKSFPDFWAYCSCEQ